MDERYAVLRRQLGAEMLSLVNTGTYQSYDEARALARRMAADKGPEELYVTVATPVMTVTDKLEPIPVTPALDKVCGYTILDKHGLIAGVGDFWATPDKASTAALARAKGRKDRWPYYVAALVLRYRCQLSESTL